MKDWERISWLEAEPCAAAREREHMAEVAPGLSWQEGPGGGWEGAAPVWPFQRERPAKLDEFTEGRELQLKIEYPQSYPMAEPLFVPVKPAPPLGLRSSPTAGFVSFRRRSLGTAPTQPRTSSQKHQAGT